MRINIVLPLLVLLALSTTSFAAALPYWNQFRGPNGSGVASTFQPPLNFDGASPAWKTSIPSGHSSPVVWENRVFVTGIEGTQFSTFAIDATSGAILWKADAPLVTLERVHEASHPAASTPCADSERVYVYFGSFGLLCYDHSGKEIWRRAIATPKSMYGTSTSPVVFNNLVILVVDNDANLEGSQLSRSRIIAFDRITGEQVWETTRPYNRSSWSTPTIWSSDKETVLAVMGNGRAYAYNPLNGKELWYVNGFSRETIAVPVVGDGKLFFSASRQGGSGDSEIDPHPFWEAALLFDKNGDGQIDRETEISQNFTTPLRPELPPGHPGFGIPLPSDPTKRLERQRSIFDWRDKNKDGFWTEEEFKQDMSVGRGRPNLAAVKPGGSGDVTDSHVVWNLRSGIPEIPSPIYHEGRIYLVRSGGVLSCVKTDDGSRIYQERLGAMGHYSASPIMANDHLYIVSNRGVVSIVETGDEFNRVHQTDIGTEIRGTPALDQNTIYIRTVDGLVAFR